MREYRKRKRVGRVDASASLPAASFGVRAPEPSRVTSKAIAGSSPQPAPPNVVPLRKAVRSRFKTALDLARTFPFGVLASQACPYCYNTGYSSPGTRCSYCQIGRDKSDN